MSKKKDRDNKNNQQADRFDLAELEQDLLAYSRRPFAKILLDCLQGAPSVDDIRAFAKKYPDRWAQASAIVGRLFGFSEKTEVVKDIHHWIHNASDMELLAKNAELERQLSELGVKSIDVTPSESREVPRTK